MRVEAWYLSAVLLSLLVGSQAAAQGTIMQSSGPVNRSMGGASVAAPIDSIGALYWNPATISGMQYSETAFGLDLLFANHTVGSSIGPFSGSTEADCGVFPIPNIGWIHHTQNPALTLGFGVNTVAGFGTNLPADPNNPVLAPAPSGLGKITSNALFLQLAPVVSWALRDNFSIAAGPTITTARVDLEPFVLDSANSNGTYAAGNGTRYHWGGGFQLGTYYIHNDDWRYGASLRSPTWMEQFEYNAEDETGMPRTLRADLDLPLIFSLGTSYSGVDDWLLALDVRYLDYENTDGFGDRATFDSTGRLTGLDYSSVLAVAFGVQREVSERLTLRGGYTYNQNPTRHGETMYTLAAPLIYQHMLSTGASLNFSERLSGNLAYSYDFENTRSGPIVLPGIGAVPGSSVSSTMDAHFLSFGLTVRQ